MPPAIQALLPWPLTCLSAPPLAAFAVHGVVLQGMQGRFSGRLGTKEDEKRLAAECRLIGPLLGGASRGEKSLHTLAKLVRAIAAGNVRQYLEEQEAERKVGGEGRPPGCGARAGGGRAGFRRGSDQAGRCGS